MGSEEVILTYPDFNKEFDIHTDASDLQLGAVISQKDENGNGCPVTFYSRKLIPVQRCYTTTEQELLSVIEMLHEFKNVLLGYLINVYMDHKNITHDAFLYSSDCVMCWVLYISEFGPKIKYIKGNKNIMADNLSRVPANRTKNSEHKNTFKEIAKIEWFLASKKASKEAMTDEHWMCQIFPSACQY